MTWETELSAIDIGPSLCAGYGGGEAVAEVKVASIVAS